MIILSHRGYWKEVAEKNQPTAFKRSFRLGFGTETDVRDIAGKLVISHDMPCGNEMTFDDLLEIMAGRNLPLAINIKADGLCDKISAVLQRYHHTNYFCFDMSIPDMLFQLKRNMIVFTGMSDILPIPVLLDKARGVWLDSFYRDWFGPATVDRLIETGKKVCVVSADLHQRDTKKQWTILKECRNLMSSDFMLCTDEPEEAKEFFYDKN